METNREKPSSELDVTFEFSGKFEASHRLKDHKGRCKNKHGHRYELDAILSGRYEKKSGMLGGKILGH